MTDLSLPVVLANLSDTERKFLQLFAADPSDLRAAETAAGMPPGVGAELLRSQRGRGAIAQLLSSKNERYAQIQQSLVELLFRIANWDVRDAFDKDGAMKHPRNLPDSIRIALTSFEYSPSKGTVEYKFESRLRAIALLQEWFLARSPEAAPGEDGRAEWIVRGRQDLAQLAGQKPAQKP